MTDNRLHTEILIVPELVGNEVERPALVWQLRHEHRGTRPQGPLAPAAAAHHELFFPIEPKQPFMVHLEALPPQQHMQAPVAEAAAFMS
jgi:hypothetical protein